MKEKSLKKGEEMAKMKKWGSREWVRDVFYLWLEMDGCSYFGVTTLQDRELTREEVADFIHNHFFKKNAIDKKKQTRLTAHNLLDDVCGERIRKEITEEDHMKAMVRARIKNRLKNDIGAEVKKYSYRHNNEEVIRTADLRKIIKLLVEMG